MTARTTTKPQSERQTRPATTSEPASVGAPASAPSIVQKKASLRGMDYATQLKALSPVQREGAGGDADVHAAAAHGTAGSGGSLPHAGVIQKAFGRHDVSAVHAHVGGAAKRASQAMGAEAYASGNDVAFAEAPSLHTAAHEAAHVVQQRAGVQLAGGVGQTGDAYERNADQVADAVVAGKSAEALLGGGEGGAAGGTAVQRTGDGTTPVPLGKLPHNIYSDGDGEGRDIQGMDVGVQALPDCFILASLATIAETNPERIRSILSPAPGGGYFVRLQGRQVLVENLAMVKSDLARDLASLKARVNNPAVPKKDRDHARKMIPIKMAEIKAGLGWDAGNVSFTDIIDGKPEVWVAVIQQAYHQTRGGKQGGDPLQSLPAIAGGTDEGQKTQVYWTESNPDLAVKIIQLVAGKHPCVLSTRKSGTVNYGLGNQHALGVLSLRGSMIMVNQTTGAKAGMEVSVPFAALRDGSVERITINVPQKFYEKLPSK